MQVSPFLWVVFLFFLLEYQDCRTFLQSQSALSIQSTEEQNVVLSLKIIGLFRPIHKERPEPDCEEKIYKDKISKTVIKIKDTTHILLSEVSFTGKYGYLSMNYD